MWTAECDLTEEYFEQFGNRVPEALTEELAQLRGRLTT
jgi:phosphoenolpyruvate carboxykinase (GTP)